MMSILISVEDTAATISMPPIFDRLGLADIEHLTFSREVLRPTNRRTQAVEKLRSAIINGVFVPGQRLSDAKLSQEAGVSRSSVREAKRFIELERLVTTVGNRTFVKSVSETEAKTIFHLLGIVFGQAMTMICERMSPRARRILYAIHESLETWAPKRGSNDAVLLFRAYYSMLLDLCRDTVLRELGENLLLRTGYLRGKVLANEDLVRASLTELSAVLSNILDRNPVGAKNAMLRHFLNQESFVCDVILVNRKQAAPIPRGRSARNDRSTSSLLPKQQS